jgi:hypothetical protein
MAAMPSSSNCTRLGQCLLNRHSESLTGSKSMNATPRNDAEHLGRGDIPRHSASAQQRSLRTFPSAEPRCCAVVCASPRTLGSMTTPLPGIHVAYRLPEYSSTVLEYAPCAITGKKRGVSPNSVVAPTEQISRPARVTIKAVSSIAFLYKVSRIGDCIFAFDIEGLSRQSKMGEFTIPWAKVERVFRLSQAYLFSMERGASMTSRSHTPRPAIGRLASRRSLLRRQVAILRRRT